MLRLPGKHSHELKPGVGCDPDPDHFNRGVGYWVRKFTVRDYAKTIA